MRSRSVLFPVTVAALLAIASACGGAKSTAAGGGDPQVATAKDAADGGAGAAAATAPRPFAGSAGEATQFIQAAVEKGSPEVLKCVVEYRTRKNLPHERVSISLGIDQEGRLLGATLPKGKEDATLSQCVQRALANAPFPRSHSGVISITKSYEEIAQ